jgi:hypothetical protein
VNWLDLALAVADPDRGQRIAAVFGIIGVLAAWWWIGTRRSRPPQRIGSERPSASPENPTTDYVAGIGRYARRREGRPRRLS